jgi:hypothetical protein
MSLYAYTTLYYVCIYNIGLYRLALIPNPFFIYSRAVLNPKLYLYLSVFTVLFTYLYSFISIFNSLIWSNFGLNILNTLSICNIYLIPLVFFWSIFFYLPAYSFIANFFIYIYLCLQKWPILLTFINYRLVLPYLTHLILIIAGILPIYLNLTTLVNWDYINLSSINYLNLRYKNLLITPTSINNTHSYGYILYVSNLMLYNSLNSFTYLNYNHEGQLFLYTLIDSVISQFILNYSYIYIFGVNIFEFDSIIIDFIFFYTFVIYYNYTLNKILVIV